MVIRTQVGTPRPGFPGTAPGFPRTHVPGPEHLPSTGRPGKARREAGAVGRVTRASVAHEHACQTASGRSCGKHVVEPGCGSPSVVEHTGRSVALCGPSASPGCNFFGAAAPLLAVPGPPRAAAQAAQAARRDPPGPPAGEAPTESGAAARVVPARLIAARRRGAPDVTGEVLCMRRTGPAPHCHSVAHLLLGVNRPPEATYHTYKPMCAR
jgi:hypothetical protein